jgi:hypothetical protein
MAECVREVCRANGIEYHEHPSFWAAVRSHTRWLRMMGRRPLPIAP